MYRTSLLDTKLLNLFAIFSTNKNRCVYVGFAPDGMEAIIVDTTYMIHEILYNVDYEPEKLIEDIVEVICKNITIEELWNTNRLIMYWTEKVFVESHLRESAEHKYEHKFDIKDWYTL
jgi:hypothetical protein